MDEVFVVIMSDYDNVSVMGAFSTEEKAQAFIDGWTDKPFYRARDMYIQDLDIDEGV